MNNQQTLALVAVALVAVVLWQRAQAPRALPIFARDGYTPPPLDPTAPSNVSPSDDFCARYRRGEIMTLVAPNCP
jgi:hypothetical protein